jgi:hypothetical protein
LKATSLPCASTRRCFLKASALAAAAFWHEWSFGAGPDRVGIPLPHFPSRLHAFVFRNWTLVPVERMAAVLGTTKGNVVRIGQSMGLPNPPRIGSDQLARSYITIIKRNWHLLPEDQLLTLLDWSTQKLAFTLREDDFLFVKLGNFKPACPRLNYGPPSEAENKRAAEIAGWLKAELPRVDRSEPLFGFLKRFSRKRPAKTQFSSVIPRFCYSYFALYGDPLLETEPYPDGYLAALQDVGVNGVWLQGLLSKFAPFPWNPSLSQRHMERLESLRRLVARARKFGVGVFLYLNEPRAMPLAFFQKHPELKGVLEGDHAALCTSVPDVQEYLTASVASICRAVPELAGIFTITASENLTNCWSHHNGAKCPRCAKRPAHEVIAEVNALIHRGIQQAGGRQQLIAWDWGWADAWAEKAIEALPSPVALMSVSEWSLPIERGGIKTTVGEYSMSAVGPGPRAKRHWAAARKRGLKVFAKIQAGNTWELSSVPYIPALENVARHAANLRNENVDGVMLGWTLGGYPSRNLEIVNLLLGRPDLSVDEALRIAARDFPRDVIAAMPQFWREISAAFREFPFHVSLVYSAPLQLGPANLLWAQPTGYSASMVGFPYDDLDGWRAVYPPEIFIAQLEKVAKGFQSALRHAAAHSDSDIAEAAAIHFQSTANQAKFVLARRAGDKSKMRKVISDEIELARRLYAIQSRDSRIGFEASNHYFYVPADLAEKIINCKYLLKTIT